MHGWGKALIGVSTLLLARGVIFENKKTERTAFISYQTFIHTGIVVQVMKLFSFDSDLMLKTEQISGMDL
ncbi:MAG: hypothetical protein ACI91R_000850 [Vicingaceae bacterium]